MDAIRARAEVERAHAERVHRMAAGDPARELGVLAQHLRRRTPIRLLALCGNGGVALPAALLTRNRDRIAGGLTGLGDVIQATIAEADDDLAGAELGIEADRLLLAAAVFRLAAPQEFDQRLGACCARTPTRTVAAATAAATTLPNFALNTNINETPAVIIAKAWGEFPQPASSRFPACCAR